MPLSGIVRGDHVHPVNERASPLPLLGDGKGLPDGDEIFYEEKRLSGRPWAVFTGRTSKGPPLRGAAGEVAATLDDGTTSLRAVGGGGVNSTGKRR